MLEDNRILISYLMKAINQHFDIDEGGTKNGLIFSILSPNIRLIDVSCSVYIIKMIFLFGKY